jgi:putative methyltransferase (TIGR04325 family)
MAINIWEGIYPSFSACPKTGTEFQGDFWAQNSLAEVKKIIEDQGDESETVLLKRNRDNYLAYLFTTLAATQSSSIKVLDFAGGVGFSYAVLLKKSFLTSRLDFSVVETPAVCKVGRELFANDTKIRFFDSPEKIEQDIKFDIIHLGSCLQYFDDWKGTLEKLIFRSKGYFVFTGLLAGNVDSFITTQNYYDSKIPVRILNLNEVNAFFSEFGYDLAFKSEYYPTYFGIEQDMPMNNLPEKNRIKRPLNLMYVKRSVSL